MTLPIRNTRIRLPQGQLFCREVGNGRALLFLHGSWGDGSQWLPVMERLGATYLCLAPDLLGCGDSDRPKLNYSVELELEVLSGYLEALRIQEVVLVGHELGGWVAASYALRHPDQVRGLVLLGAEGVKLEGVKGRWTWERWLTARPPLVAWLLPLVVLFSKLLGQRRSLDSLRRLKAKLRRSPAACRMLFGRRKPELQAELLNERVAWLKLPLLIIQGEGDRSIAAALNQVYAQAPEARLQIIPEAGEQVLTENPDAVTAEIQAFVRSLS